MQLDKIASDCGARLTTDQEAMLETWVREFCEGVKVQQTIPKCDKVLTIYGSARVGSNDQDYKDIETIGRKLREMDNWVVVTGGGPGIMTAALQDSIDNKVDSVFYGININKERDKAYFEADAFYTFTQFSVRKHFLRQSNAFIIAPGGFGTLDEVFELLTLIQTHKKEPVPVVFYNSEYWQPLIEWFESRLLLKGTISRSDLNLFRVLSKPEEVIEYFKEFK